MRKADLQLLVQGYCTEHNVKTRWNANLPGKDWIRNFRLRWKKEIKLRRPTNIKRSRSKVSPAIVRAFMERISQNLEGVPPSHIFNYDETNVQDDPGAEEAFFGGGCKYFEQARNSSKVAFSVMFCASASGLMLKPYTVHKSPTGVLYESWCQGGPEGAAYGANKSGWFDVDRFNAWFKHCFVTHIRNA